MKVPGRWAIIHGIFPAIGYAGHTGAIRVAMAVSCAVQYATPHSIEQHPCALQHNASQVYIYLALYWQHLGDNLVYNTLV